MITTFRRILAFWSPHRGIGVGLAIAMVFRAVFTIVLALAIEFVIDQVIEPTSDTPMWMLLLFLGTGFTVSFIAGIVAANLSARASADIIADVRVSVFEHLQALPMWFHDRATAGDLIGHFSSDIAQLSRGVITTPLIGLRSLAAMALYIPVMFLFDWRLATVSIVVIPIVVWLVYRYAPDSEAALDEEKQGVADVLDEVSTNLRVQLLLRSFGAREGSIRRFRGRIDHLRDASRRAETRIGLETVISEYALEATNLSIILLGASFAFAGSLDPGAFAAFSAILIEFSYQASLVGMDVLPAIKQSEAGIRRIDRLLSVEPDTVPDHAVIAPDLRTGIRLTDVRLRYRSDGPDRVDGLSIDIPAMSHVAIVGANGSGKTSVLSALLGLYPLAGGSVAVGGVDLSTVDIDELRTRVGVAFQQTLLLDGSLRENVTLGDERYTDADLDRAIRAAGLEGIVDRLVHGVDTEIGGSGLVLSGGEAQRVGIARAIIRDPQMLLLDEVSSGLDPASEADLLRVIDQLRESRSIISVTHRLESARNADLILVMEGGRLVEQGAFDELLLAGGVFESMWTKQHGFDVSANGLSATVTPERLARIPLFKDLDHATLESLATRFQSELVDHDQVVFEEGGVGDAFYVIARGVVDVIRRGADGPRVVATLADGDFFGEMALLSSDRRNATVRTKGVTTLLRLDQQAFDDLMASAPEARAIIDAAAAARAEQNRSG